MGWRDSIRSNPAVGGAVALVILALAGWILTSQLKTRQTSRPTGQWFYELQSGQLITADLNAIPPIDVSGGGEAVRARVYGCGSCREADQKVAVLEKYPPDVVKFLRSPLPVDPNSVQAEGYRSQRDSMMVTGLLIASPPAKVGDAVTWVHSEGPAGMTVVKAADGLCGDLKPLLCVPQ